MKNLIKLIVAGSRDFDNEELAYKVLDTLTAHLVDISGDPHSEVQIVSGKATGADKIGEQYAQDHYLGIKEFPADWKKYGNAAGPIRNNEMASYADALVCFWDGQSKGTKNMIKLAQDAGLSLFIYNYHE